MNKEIRERMRLIKRGIVPEGYKKSQIGIIPKEWKSSKLSSINSITTGLTPLRSKSEYFGGSIHWVKTTDLNNSYIYDTEEKITEIAMSETSLKYVEENSILIAMYGGFNQIGRTGLMKVRGTTNQAISSFYIDETENNSEFVLHWLNSNRGYWKKLAASSRKDPNITKKDVEDFPIVKLDYLEQKKIANIISIWDKIIDLKEKLLQQKQKQKKGLMQRFLTGKVRIKGFNDKWDTIKLGSAIDVIKKESLSNPQEYNLLTVKLHVKGIEATDKKPNTTEKGRPYYLREPGELLIGRQNFHNGGIGIVPQDMKGYIASNAITSLKVNNGDLKFYFYYLSNSSFYKRVYNIIGGTGQKEISETVLKKLKVKVPTNINEQRAIAKVISVADYEVKLLEKEIELLKEQKKGLMQLLLTGIVRVKCD